MQARRVKHIGIVACSAEGAALCYQAICREALMVAGKHGHPRITLDSIALARWLPALDAPSSKERPMSSLWDYRLSAITVDDGSLSGDRGKDAAAEAASDRTKLVAAAEKALG